MDPTFFATNSPQRSKLMKLSFWLAGRPVSLLPPWLSTLPRPSGSPYCRPLKVAYSQGVFALLGNPRVNVEMDSIILWEDTIGKNGFSSCVDCWKGSGRSL